MREWAAFGFQSTQLRKLGLALTFERAEHEFRVRKKPTSWVCQTSCHSTVFPFFSCPPSNMQLSVGPSTPSPDGAQSYKGTWAGVLPEIRGGQAVWDFFCGCVCLSVCLSAFAFALDCLPLPLLLWFQCFCVCWFFASTVPRSLSLHWAGVWIAPLGVTRLRGSCGPTAEGRSAH